MSEPDPKILRAEAAEYRRWSKQISDVRVARNLEAQARQLEERARRIEDAAKPA